MIAKLAVPRDPWLQISSTLHQNDECLLAFIIVRGTATLETTIAII